MDARLADDVCGIAAHEQRFYTGFDGSDLVEGFFPILSWHDDIKEKQ